MTDSRYVPRRRKRRTISSDVVADAMAALVVSHLAPLPVELGDMLEFWVARGLARAMTRLPGVAPRRAIIKPE